MYFQKLLLLYLTAYFRPNLDSHRPLSLAANTAKQLQNYTNNNIKKILSGRRHCPSGNAVGTTCKPRRPCTCATTWSIITPEGCRVGGEERLTIRRQMREQHLRCILRKDKFGQRGRRPIVCTKPFLESQLPKRPTIGH